MTVLTRHNIGKPNMTASHWRSDILRAAVRTRISDGLKSPTDEDRVYTAAKLRGGRCRGVHRPVGSRYEEAMLLRHACGATRSRHEVTLALRALYEDRAPRSTISREAVTTLEETERTARRVFGGRTRPLGD